MVMERRNLFKITASGEGAGKCIFLVATNLEVEAFMPEAREIARDILNLKSHERLIISSVEHQGDAVFA